jgi:hypothetical protein
MNECSKSRKIKHENSYVAGPVPIENYLNGCGKHRMCKKPTEVKNNIKKKHLITGYQNRMNI